MADETKQDGNGKDDIVRELPYAVELGSGDFNAFFDPTRVKFPILDEPDPNVIGHEVGHSRYPFTDLRDITIFNEDGMFIDQNALGAAAFVDRLEPMRPGGEEPRVPFFGFMDRTRPVIEQYYQAAGPMPRIDWNSLNPKGKGDTMVAIDPSGSMPSLPPPQPTDRYGLLRRTLNRLETAMGAAEDFGTLIKVLFPVKDCKQGAGHDSERVNANFVLRWNFIRASAGLATIIVCTPCLNELFSDDRQLADGRSVREVLAATAAAALEAWRCLFKATMPPRSAPLGFESLNDQWEYFQSRCQGIAEAESVTVSEVAARFIDPAARECHCLLNEFRPCFERVVV